jgi:hypothetical protein
MIRIDLVDQTNKLKHVEFHVLPVTEESDFTCIPAGILSLRRVMRLSQLLKNGQVAGNFGKFVWYRLMGTSQTKRREPLATEI